jgi:hypothetical protein
MGLKVTESATIMPATCRGWYSVGLNFVMTCHNLSIEAPIIRLSCSHQLRKDAAALGEFGRSATLNKAAVREHQQMVTVDDGVDTVRNHKHDSLQGGLIAMHGITQRLLNDLIRVSA